VLLKLILRKKRIEMYNKYGLFLDGQWRSKSGGGTLDVTDPGTGEIIGHVPSASKKDVLDALASAEAGAQL
jgi:succinate-semialdehyde dehydrogenase / glutarate-semialdehyde dehydrogenase